MKNMQQVGGYAAIILGLALLTLLTLVFAALPGLGVTMSDFADPQSISKYGWTLPVFNWIDVIGGITTLLVALALRERMQSGAPSRMRLATIFASVSTALFLGAGITQINGWPGILSSRGGGAPAIAVFYVLAGGLESAGGFAGGWMFLLWGWAGLTTKGLPSLLSYFFVASGILGVASIVIPAIWLLGTVLNIIGMLWLGMVLLKK